MSTAVFDEKRNRTIEGSEFSFEIEQGIASDTTVGDINERFKKPVRKKRMTKFTAESAHILIVDDISVNLVVATRLLKNTKIKIDTASSGEEALRLVKENKYDVILLDHVMPKMDGLQTLKKMKEMKDNRSVNAPVISMSADDFSDERYSYAIIKESGEFVINLVTKDLVKACDWCGVRSGRDCDKFAKQNLSAYVSDYMDTPAIAESPVNIYCRVKDVLPLGSHDMFISEVTGITVDVRYMNESGKFELNSTGLVTYSHGEYFTLGQNLGRFGFSVKKK